MIRTLIRFMVLALLCFPIRTTFIKAQGSFVVSFTKGVDKGLVVYSQVGRSIEKQFAVRVLMSRFQPHYHFHDNQNSYNYYYQERNGTPVTGLLSEAMERRFTDYVSGAKDMMDAIALVDTIDSLLNHPTESGHYFHETTDNILYQCGKLNNVIPFEFVTLLNKGFSSKSVFYHSLYIKPKLDFKPSKL